MKKLEVSRPKGRLGAKEKKRIAARNCLMPPANAAFAIGAFRSDLDIVEVAIGIIENLNDVDTVAASELTLRSQACSLDALFATLSRRSAANAKGGYFDAAMGYLKLALRAQNQCRATLETLATIKNPPVVFAKQANIAHGHQQVNNGAAIPPARVENENGQTGLLENDHGQRLDTGTPGAASRGDPAMATVEAIHRPANEARKD